MVSRRLLPGSEASLSAVERLRAEGRGVAHVRGLPRPGRLQRASTRRHRRRRDCPLELLLSSRRESGRRRHPQSARVVRASGGASGAIMSDARLTPPVSAADHVAGPDDAAVTLVEYGDYECPYCGMAYPIVKAAQRALGNRMRFVFRNFPLAESHPHARQAANAAEAAAAQGKFWEMHDTI